VISKAIHISLAILVYLSSIGYTLGKHYCKGELKATAIFAKAEPCRNHQTMDLSLLGISEEIQSPRSCCTKPAESQEDHKGCCEDETEYFHVEIENIVTEPFSLDEVLPVLLTLFPYLLSNSEIENNPGAQAQYLNFHPPSLSLDRTVLFDSFLI